MISVLIFGVGNGFENIQKILDYNKINILGFIDNNKVGQYYNNFKIISPTDICNFKFDIIIVASQYYNEIRKQLLDLAVSEDKILSYYKYLEFIYKEYVEIMWEKYCCDEIGEKLELLNKMKDEVESIITGISYAKFGVIEKELKKSVINLALPRQDLYYDYSLMKHILKKNTTYKNLSLCIIGMSYYTFQYDLSLTKWGNRCLTVYNKILNDTHNYDNNKHNCKRLYSIVDKLRIIFKDEYIDGILSKEVGKINFEEFWNMNLDKLSKKEKIFKGKETALQDSNKYYPTTVRENKRIFEEYILLLREKNITPICVVFPISKYYYKNFSKQLKKEFYDIISEFRCKYNLQIFDYFESKLFNDEDFCDPFHLNRNGAVKFSKILNEEVL